jgi:hypothetical protein
MNHSQANNAPTSADSRPKSSRGEKIFKRVLFAIGLVSFVIMIFTFKVSREQLLTLLRRSWYIFPAVIAMWIPLYLMNAWAWRKMLQGQGRDEVSLLTMFRWTISGFALNSLTPMGLLGGEPYKIVELKRLVGTERATSSVILFSMMHIYTHFWFWLTSIAVYLLLCLVGNLTMSVPIAIVLAFGGAFSLGGVYLFRKGYKHGFIMKLLRGLGHVWGLRKWATRMQVRHHDALTTIDSQISQLHSQDRSVYNACFWIEYVGRLLMSCEGFLILLMLGVGNGSTLGGYLLLWLHSMLILAFTSLFANLLGFIPMQMGTREGGYALSAAQFGFTAGVGMVISVVCRLREVVWDAIGLLLMKKK